MTSTCSPRISANARMIVSLVLTLLFFIVSTVLVEVDTDSCKYLVIISVAVLFQLLIRINFYFRAARLFSRYDDHSGIYEL